MRGVTDNRSHMNWLDADMAADRRRPRGDVQEISQPRRVPRSYQVEHERVKLIEDRDGDGKADRSTVFADGFKDAADGIGAGLLARKGDVYYTCIPDLWRLRDKDGDGKAEVKESLSTGYGVHVAFLGHDLHGLKMGPDGRLYFSVGDRGLNVTTKEGKHLYAPDCGSVLRCEPDGSNLEIFATGLRNPAGTRLRQLRQPVHLRQQFRRRRQGPMGPRRRRRRQRLADGLSVPRLPDQSRPLERREALASPLGRPGRLHRPADHQHLRRSLGPGP